MARRPVRIANFSGALGDRFSALAEVVTGEPVDVAIGDYMAEITMAMVASQFSNNSGQLDSFSVDTFLEQLKPQLAAIAQKGIKVVVNAGVFHPAGLAAKVQSEIRSQGLSLTVAHVEGDDIHDQVDQLRIAGQLQHMDYGVPQKYNQKDFLAVNAYLGGWGIAAALREGADIVITGRVSDASLVLGPAAWWHEWARNDWDKLAGAIAAGHIIECGPQAAGGNFAGFTELPRTLVFGFPIAEIAADGSSVITKRANDGGAVTVDTVTAQLMYEIQGPRYLNPDVIWHTDSVSLTQEAPDRVRVSGVKGSPPPVTTKVGMYYRSGYRTSFWGYPTGLDIQAKIALFTDQMAAIAAKLDLDEFLITPCGQPIEDPKNQGEATVPVRVAAAAQSLEPLQKLHAGFSGIGLGSFPGFYGDVAAPSLQVRVEYWPGLVAQADLQHRVVFEDGHILTIGPSPTEEFSGQPAQPAPAPLPGQGATKRAPLGEVIFTRTGDKGANANLGIWSRSPEAWEWVRRYLTKEELGRLVNAPENVVVERYELPNLHGILFVLKGYFGHSGSGNLAMDQIGKSIGEFVRARHADIPVELLR